MRFMASPALAAPRREMKSWPIMSITAVAVCLSANNPVSEAFSISPGTTNSSISSISATASNRISLKEPAATEISGTVLGM